MDRVRAQESQSLPADHSDGLPRWNVRQRTYFHSQYQSVGVWSRMHHAQIRRHLDQADKLVALFAALVQRQRLLVADIERSSGRPIAIAAKLLDTFEDLQAAYVVDRDCFRAWLDKDLAEADGPSPRPCTVSGITEDQSPDPRAVAVVLDELVEETYSILSDCGDQSILTAHRTINQLLCLFESGGGFEARCQAEQLLRQV